MLGVAWFQEKLGTWHPCKVQQCLKITSFFSGTFGVFALTGVDVGT
jgi:hypothetical protein